MPRRSRWSLLILPVPVVLYLLTPVVANSIQPVVLGLPFAFAYVLIVTVITPLLVWLVARLDPFYRENRGEYIPVDAAFEDTYHADFVEEDA
ncbi:DUF3311 domain-containing protein [Brevibacterium sp. 50QC2O2]|mgnify:CR=1 FL=1|uniref:DUF3311 domain-containing protein n=1 Tax=Brevibacterium TaxID=1696 RepID=UPI00211BEAA1|nr:MULTISPECIES: DUF3311 domain-containing protein [unclassified Brevibacterium]MCQ9386329.1 DUF3311 domain-containing protein [Brevibacterium sp. 68QC2CO]MCQ9389464.1 DUF3311 domain-containing protein [Brevibacterium sp. 50QC2O2]